MSHRRTLRWQTSKKAGDWQRLLVEEIIRHPQEDLSIMLADQLGVGDAFEEWLSEPRTSNTTRRQKVTIHFWQNLRILLFNLVFPFQARKLLKFWEAADGKKAQLATMLEALQTLKRTCSMLTQGIIDKLK